jgi:hypothetical protein
MGQYIHLLTNTGISLPTDLWVPSTNKLKPQTSDQVALGGVYSLNGVYEFSLEGYYKTMNNVLEYKEGSSFLDIDKEWENKILQGTGKSYGVELFAQKKTGVITGWIGYTLSWTKRQFDELNNGKWFDYKYDRRHDISVVALYRPNKKVELSGTWVFGTGNAITLPLAEYYPKNPFDPNGYGGNSNMIYSERNSYRMNAYHRLDLSISLIKKKKYGERRWTFGIYNVYSRKNPFFVDLESRDDYSNGYPVTTKKFVQYSIFPIIPSVSYNYKF